MKALRWKAIVPLGLLLAAIATLWILFLDTAVERTVESIGAELVGARVDVTSADVSLMGGRVSIRGLQAANPDAPMSNLVEVDEIRRPVLLNRMPQLLETEYGSRIGEILPGKKERNIFAFVPYRHSIREGILS